MKVEAYQLFLDVEAGNVSPEEAQIELLEMLETVKRESPDVYSGVAIKNCPLAIYEVFWKEGGSSVASIGYTHDGTRWLAPTNWTCKNDDNPTCLLNDERIATIDRIVLLYTQNRD